MKQFGFHSGQRLQVLPLQGAGVVLPPIGDAHLVVLIDASLSMFTGGNQSAWDADMDGISGTAHDIVGATLAEFLMDVQAWCDAARYTLSLILIPYEAAPLQGTVNPETAVARGVALGGTTASTLRPAVAAAADWFTSVAASPSDRNRVVLLSDGRTLTRTWISLTPGADDELVPNAVESAAFGLWEFYGSSDQPNTTGRSNAVRFRGQVNDMAGQFGTGVYVSTGPVNFQSYHFGGVFDLAELAPPDAIASGLSVTVDYLAGQDIGWINEHADLALYSAPDPALPFSPSGGFGIGGVSIPDGSQNTLYPVTLSATTHAGNRYLHLRFTGFAGAFVTDLRVTVNNPASIPAQVAGLLSPFAATLHPRYVGHPVRATPEALATLEAVNTGIVRAGDRRFLMVTPSDRPLSLNPADIFGPGGTTARRALQLENGAVLTLENGAPLELEF